MTPDEINQKAEELVCAVCGKPKSAHITRPYGPFWEERPWCNDGDNYDTFKPIQVLQSLDSKLKGEK